jgi:hypothetical protein
LREENARFTRPAGLDGRKMPALHLAPTLPPRSRN